MDDLIRRQDAIDALDITPLEVHDYELAVGVIKDLPSAQQWIPCSEMLPEEYVQVLCYQPKVIADEMWIGYINEKGIWVKGSGWEQYTNPVTAWMPLPLPYREEN